MSNLQEKIVSFLSIWGNVLTLGNGIFLILCQVVLHSNIKFRQKLIQKCWSNRLVLLFLDMPYLLHKQTKTKYKYKSNINKQMNKHLYCNELHLFSTLFLLWFQSYTEQVFMFGMYLVPTSICKFKRHSK